MTQPLSSPALSGPPSGSHSVATSPLLNLLRAMRPELVALHKAILGVVQVSSEEMSV